MARARPHRACRHRMRWPRPSLAVVPFEVACCYSPLRAITSALGTGLPDGASPLRKNISVFKKRDSREGETRSKARTKYVARARTFAQVATTTVVASEARQSMVPHIRKRGLLRRFAPRNDGVETSRENYPVVVPAEAGTHYHKCSLPRDTGAERAHHQMRRLGPSFPPGRQSEKACPSHSKVMLDAAVRGLNSHPLSAQ